MYWSLSRLWLRNGNIYVDTDPLTPVNSYNSYILIDDVGYITYGPAYVIHMYRNSDGIVQNMDWTGLDNWTGQLDWTIGLDSWAELLDWISNGIFSIK